MFKTMKKRRNGGFSLAEVLIVVSIIAILLAVAIPNVIGYYRSLKLTELDDSARSIFMAAQNRLTALKNEGRKLESIGTGAIAKTSEGNNVNVKYVMKTAATTGADLEQFHTILPGGSVDSQLQDYNMVVEFAPDTGAVFAVWYWEKGDFNYTADAYKSSSIADPDNKDTRLDKMVGYYGGSEINRPSVGQTPIPAVTVTNAEELVLDISVPGNNFGPDTPTIEMTVTISNDDGDNKEIIGKAKLTQMVVTSSVTNYIGRIALDTLEESKYTTKNATTDLSGDGMGKHFKDWVGGSDITPGENINIEIKVEASVISGGKTTTYLPQTVYCEGVNSLFASVDNAGNKAEIAYGRHLQNLDTDTSGVDGITEAEQIRPIDFNDAATVKGVYSWQETYRDKKFTAITNSELTSYDGKKNTISNLYVDTTGDAGLFGSTSGKLDSISGTYLVDATVKTTSGNAGALVGNVDTALTIFDCRVLLNDPYGKDGAGKVTTYKIEGANVGGLVGSVNVTTGEVTIDKSFASTTENGTASVGGLVGNVESGTLKINNSYAAGYLKGTNVGGLVGETSGTGTVKVDDSYAAGIIASATTTAAGISTGSATIANSYAAVRYSQDVANGSKAAAPTVTVYGVAPGTPSAGSTAFYVKQNGVNYQAGSGEGKSASVLKKMVTDSFGTPGEWNTGTGVMNEDDKATPYKQTPETEDLEPPYPYPMLKDADGNVMHHFGDWLENNYATSFYWEKEDSDYKFYLVLSDGTTKYVADSLCTLHHLNDGLAGQHIDAWGYGLIGIDAGSLTTYTGPDESSIINGLITFAEKKDSYGTAKPITDEPLEDITALLSDTSNVILLEGSKSDDFHAIQTDAGYIELNLGFAAAIDVTDAASPTPTNMGKNADNAYQIRTTWQLDSINSDSGLNTSSFKQTHDIVYETAGTPHTEIQNFAGHYDGGFFRMLDIDSSLFMSLNGTARLEHIILYSPDGADISGHGGLAMSSVGTGVGIEKCVVAGFNFSEASGAVGGLVGEVANGTLSITDCEAVNELGATVSTGSTANVGGLVGNVSSGATLTITGSYAGGKIEAATDSAGGLVGAASGTVNYTGGVYSYVEMDKADVTASEIHGIGPGTIESGGTAQYWSGGLNGKTATDDTGVAAVSLSDLKAGVTSTNQAQHTYIPDETDHNFVKGLEDQNDTSINNPYPFTPVVTVAAGVYEGTTAPVPVHYGKWAEESAPSAQSFGYYDNGGGNGSNVGFYGYIVDPTTSVQTFANSLNPGTPGGGEYATIDGYCIPVERVGGTSTAPTAPTVDGVPGISVENTPVGTYTDSATSKTYDLYKVNGLDGVGATKYYNEITVGTTKYWFNPFFACEVQKDEPTDKNVPGAKEGAAGQSSSENYDGQVVIRTARQLVWLGELTQGVDEKGELKSGGTDIYGNPYFYYTYQQLLDIDYTKYSDYGDEFTGRNNNNGTLQLPVNLLKTTQNGLTANSPKGPGNYDGHGHSVENLKMEIGASHTPTIYDAGLFGVAKSGEISNIRLVNASVKTEVDNARVSVGGLIGETMGKDTKVTNCGIYIEIEAGGDYDGAYETQYVIETTKDGDAGGLIGNVGGNATIKNCFAAVRVKGFDNAGGLAGITKDNVTIENCYSGGHTSTGTYSSKANVTAKSNAGGLVGILGGDKIDSDPTKTNVNTFKGVCYSTCSVEGATVGKLIGSYDGLKENTDPSKDVNCPPTVTDATLYAVGAVIGTSTPNADAHAVDWENDHIITPTPAANLADILAATNGKDLATASKYDDTLGASYPYLTASGAEHHGDWPELKEAVFYWEKEGNDDKIATKDADGGTYTGSGYHFFAKGYLNGQEVTLDTLCKTHHTVAQVVTDGTNAMSNDQWGYGTVGTLTVNILTQDATSTAGTTQFRNLFSLGNAATVNSLSGGNEGTATSTTGSIYKVNPNFGVDPAQGFVEYGSSPVAPYQIRNVKQLDNIPDSDTSGKYYRQAHDLCGKDYPGSGVSYTGATAFAGTFYGGVYVIHNLSMTNGGLFTSLAGTTGTTTVRDVILYSNDASSRATISGTDVGGIAGTVSGSAGEIVEITNCAVAGYNMSGTNVGGLVGRVSSSGRVNINKCEAVNTFIGTTGTTISMGGLVGQMSGSSNLVINYSYAGGKITGGATSVGGLLGHLTAGSANYNSDYSYMDMTGATASSCYAIGGSGAAGNYGHAECFYLQNMFPAGKYGDEGTRNGLSEKSSLYILGSGMTKYGDFSTPYTVTGYKSDGNTEIYPSSAVVQKVNSYNTDGTPNYGEHVHYGDWPTA